MYLLCMVMASVGQVPPRGALPAVTLHVTVTDRDGVREAAGVDRIMGRKMGGGAGADGAVPKLLSRV